jgi:hypothetical protein
VILLIIVLYRESKVRHNVEKPIWSREMVYSEFKTAVKSLYPHPNLSVLISLSEEMQEPVDYPGKSESYQGVMLLCHPTQRAEKIR